MHQDHTAQGTYDAEQPLTVEEKLSLLRVYVGVRDMLTRAAAGEEV